MRRAFPRSEYLHTHEWVKEMIEARLHLPWLPFWVRFARAAVIIALVWAAALGAVIGIPLWLLGLPFWPPFAVGTGLGLAFWAVNWIRFWRFMRHDRRRHIRHGR